MKKEMISKLTKSFEESAHIEQGIEFWMARDIQELLEYNEWRNFLNVVDKAKISCEKARQSIEDHFVDINKMVDIGTGGTREVPDMMLSRFACYLVAQNGDPRKESIAFAQSYFALQTRKQELLEKRIEMAERLEARKKLSQTERELSATLYEHGIDDQGFARIRSKGDRALFGGFTTIQMKHKLGIPESRPLADFLPTITIKAKDFAGEITHFNVKKEGLLGEDQITEEHEKNNRDVRSLLSKSNILPENLPPEEDIKRLEKLMHNEKKKISNTVRSLPKKKLK